MSYTTLSLNFRVMVSVSSRGINGAEVSVKVRFRVRVGVEWRSVEVLPNT